MVSVVLFGTANVISQNTYFFIVCLVLMLVPTVMALISYAIDCYRGIYSAKWKNKNGGKFR